MGSSSDPTHPRKPASLTEGIRWLGKVLASAFMFLCLGIGGLLLSLLVVPWLWLLPKARRKRTAGQLIKACFSLFVLGLRISGILRVSAVDLPTEAEVRGAILVANHPSWLDIVVLLAILPRTLCVVKSGVWRNPAFGFIVRTAGFLPVEDTEAFLEHGTQVLREGQSLILFPEGTRTVPGHPIQFQRGAAHLALRSGARVCPLLLTMDPPLLVKGDRWYDVPLPTCLFCIRGGQPFTFDATESEGPPGVQQARQATKLLEAYYHQELHGHSAHPP